MASEWREIKGDLWNLLRDIKLAESLRFNVPNSVDDLFPSLISTNVLDFPDPVQALALGITPAFVLADLQRMGITVNSL